MLYKFLISIIFFLPLAGIAQDTKPSKTTPVILAEVKRVQLVDEVEALGTLKANESVDLSSSVTELVTKVLFTDNQRVKKGDTLIEMDTAEELAELEEQKSIFDEAQRQVNRLSPLVKRGAASASALDENKRELATAKARIDAIQSRISQRIIKAPYNGTLGLKNISVGTLLQPGSIITTIDDDSVMKLDFSVPEVFLSTLKKGIVVNARTEAYPEKIFNGTIQSIDSRIDPVTRSIQVRALIRNEDRMLKPGLLMKVVLQKNPRQALIIPEEALIVNGNTNHVWLVYEAEEITTAKKRLVELGQRKFGDVEVLSGLSEGDKIVTHGTLRIRPGIPINAIAIETDNNSLIDLLEQKNKEGQLE